MRYAKNTTVSVNRSRDEIEKILTRYGADQFVYCKENSAVMIGFRYQRIPIVLDLSLPDPKDFEETPQGRTRAVSVGLQEWEKACRQQWRALALIIKAKLEGIESGITTFEKEFLAFISLPNGSTVADIALPKITKALSENKMPKLMLMAPSQQEAPKEGS